MIATKKRFIFILTFIIAVTTLFYLFNLELLERELIIKKYTGGYINCQPPMHDQKKCDKAEEMGVRIAY